MEKEATWLSLEWLGREQCGCSRWKQGGQGTLLQSSGRWQRPDGRSDKG